MSNISFKCITKLPNCGTIQIKILSVSVKTSVKILQATDMMSWSWYVTAFYQCYKVWPDFLQRADRHKTWLWEILLCSLPHISVHVWNKRPVFSLNFSPTHPLCLSPSLSLSLSLSRSLLVSLLTDRLYCACALTVHVRQKKKIRDKQREREDIKLYS